MTALDHLRKLVAIDPTQEECPYCSIFGDDRFSHAPDCSWVAAKAFAEEADKRASDEEATDITIARLARELEAEDRSIIRQLAELDRQTIEIGRTDWKVARAADLMLRQREIHKQLHGFTMIELLVRFTNSFTALP